MKSFVPRIWMILMHTIMKGLSEKYGGSASMSNDWLQVIYNIFTIKINDVDLPEVLRYSFGKFAIHQKTSKISSPRFQALTLQQIYLDRVELVPLMSDPPKLHFTFELIKSYCLPNHNSFGPIQRPPNHMLDILHSDSPQKSKHLEILTLVDPLSPT